MHWKWSVKWKETEITIKRSFVLYLPFNMLLLVIFLHTYSIIYRNMARMICMSFTPIKIN